MKIHQLFTLLSVVGEYPVYSLDLLGEKRSTRQLVADLTAKQEFWNIDNNEVFDCVAIGLSGTGKFKTIRLKKKALPLLNWCGGEKFYEETYSQTTFSGVAEKVDRNHRVAEVVAMMQGAGVEYRPWAMPQLQTDIRDVSNISEVVYYTSREIKKLFDETTQFIGCTRFTGALITPNDCFSVYNARDSVMKWGHAGEDKALISIRDCVVKNSHNNNVQKMILMGRSLENAMETISQSENQEADEIRKHRKQSFKSHTSITSIYRNVYYVPLSEFGQKILRILTIPDYHDKLLRLIYEEDEISNGKDGFIHDAYRNGVYVLSFLDGNVSRLQQFKRTIEAHQERGKNLHYAVLCFTEQRTEIMNYMGEKENVSYPNVKIDNVLKNLKEDGDL